MEKNRVSIFTKVVFSILVTMTACVLVVEMSNLYVIRQNRQRAEELYENSLEYYCSFWGERLRILNKSLLMLMSRENGEDYNTLCESDSILDVEISKIMLRMELARIAEQNESQAWLFVTVPERGCWVTSAQIWTQQEEQEVITTIQGKIERERVSNNENWEVLHAGEEVYLMQLYHVSDGYVGAVVKGEELLEGLWGKAETADEVEIRQADGTVIAHLGESLEGGKILTFQQEVALTDIRLTALLKDSRLYSSSLYTLVQMLCVAALVLVIISVELSVQKKTIFEPLETLLRAMERFGGGDMEARVAVNNKNKQIGRLHRTFNEMTGQIVHLKFSVYERELERQKIKSNYLRIQIQPHFYANILNLIYGMAQIQDCVGIQKLSKTAAGYFRYLLGVKSTLVLLSEELRALDSFVEIEKFRYGDHVKIHVAVQEGLENQLVLPLLIQTFVENSVKHNVTLVPVLEVHVQIYREDDMLMIRVEDNGVGFTPKLLRRLNEGEDISENGEHIGIQNVRERIRSFYEKDADIQIMSQKGSTVVTVCLPQVVVAEGGREMNVLLVDDEVKTIEILKKALDWEKFGFSNVFSAYNGEEARRILAKHRVDIMICDIEMPKESGLDLIRWLQDFYPEIVCIILTAFPDFNYARSAISLGVYRFLLKPVAFDELEETICKAMEKVEQEKLWVRKGHHAQSEEEHSMVRKVRQYLEEHYNEVITRKDIESLVHMNQDHVNRKFKQAEGYTLMQYIQYYRILMAKNLLRDSNLTVAEISVETGYDSPAYFSKVFKKWTDQTPVEYREEHRSKSL